MQNNNKQLEILRKYKDILYDYLYENNLGKCLKKIGLASPVNGDH
jgi:hypothetical protein